MANAAKAQSKKAIPTVVTDPSLIALDIIEQIKATKSWIEPNNAEAVPLFSVNGVIASSVVVGNSMPIGNT